MGDMPLKQWTIGMVVITLVISVAITVVMWM
jgi:hypothetical protein